MRERLLCVVGVLAAGTGPAWAAGAATGTFSYKTATAKIVDAYAYRAKAEFGDDQVIAVRLSTVPLDHAAIDAALDRARAAEAAAAQSPSIVLEFDTTGRLAGASYSLGGGNSCGYCSAPSSAPGGLVKMQDDALRGPLKITAADRGKDTGAVMSLALDVKVTPEIATTPLPSGGGVVGRSLLACRTAVQKKDPVGFHKFCAAADQASLKEAEDGGGGLDGFWSMGTYGEKALALKTLTVTGGGTAGDQAVLTVEGKDEDTSYKGKVYLHKDADGWRYEHDALEAVY